MTTYDDTGLFDTADGIPDEPAPPRRTHVTTVLLVAAALVVAGVVWLLVAARQGPAEPEPISVELLTRAAQPTDALAATAVDETGVDPASTRFAVRTTAGQHYAARRWNGDLCLVVLPDGDVARAACVTPSRGAVVTMNSADGSRVRLGTDEAPVPDAAEGWRPAGTNVWVLDAPVTDGA